MTMTLRRKAEKISFKLVPETCPSIDKFLDEINTKKPISKQEIEDLRKLIKEKTVALRELGFKYIESTLSK